MNQAGPDQQLEALLEHLRRTRGFDFTGYKRSTLGRRVTKRMTEVGMGSFADYLDHLEVHPEEFPHLFDTLLINVTGFFRDPAAWEYLVGVVIPQIVAARRGSDAIRAWSAGCASGEEAYTLAIVLAEALGVDAFRKRVKVYATDADEGALAQARLGSYTAKVVADVPGHLREKYFDAVGDHHVFKSDLRRSVIFGRHDLVQDAPISRLDVLACRNTLMYLNADVQSRILRNFRFALREAGVLFLGKAEMLLAHDDLFAPIELQYRIFRPHPRTPARGLPYPALPTDNSGGMDRAIRDAAFDAQPIAQVAVDSAGVLLLANERARGLFRLSPQDLGRPWHELEFSYRPIELRSRVEQAYAERRAIRITDVERARPGGETQYLDVEIAPLRDPDGGLLGVSVTFADATVFHGLKIEHERATHELHSANEELQATNEELKTTNEELQSTNEELETTNEELQSTNEELETTNEELQSTNEEMETMNEELQSTNEELETLNRELRDRTAELEHANLFLEAILGGLDAGVMVLDRALIVTAWNRRSEDLWGLRPEEVVGQNVFTLDMGLPVEGLRPLIQQCLTGASGATALDGRVIEAVNRRGTRIECRVSATALLGPDRIVHGVILVIQEVRP